MANPVRILETTLRDGSYEINFQFSAADTALFVSALDKAGLSYIELCNGNGFGFDRWKNMPLPRRNRAAASDEAYLDAARSVAPRAKLGVVYVVERQFLELTELDVLKKHGADFVRFMFLPTNVDDPETLVHIDKAKSIGLDVAANLTQSYALSPSEVARAAVECKRRGADWFYVVDSAGGMTPDEVASYVRAVRDATGMIVGLHAHNNSGLAVANCLAAIEAGATMCDATLQGMGRTTGNPPTEQLMLALQRLGHEQELDREAVFRMGDLVRSVIVERGNDPTHFAFGAARMHWGNVGKMIEVAKEKGRAPREFVMRAAAEAKRRGMLSAFSYPADLIDHVVEHAPVATSLVPSEPLVRAVADGIAQSSSASFAAICESMWGRTNKRDKQGVLHLVPRASLPFARPLPWEDGRFVGVTIGVDASPRFDDVPADRWPAWVLADPSITLPTLPASVRVLRDRFAALEIDAAADLAAATSAPVVVVGDAPMLKVALEQRGVQVTTSRANGPTTWICDGVDAAWASRVARGDIVVLIGGRDSETQVGVARSAGARVLRPNLGAVAAARMQTLAAAAAALGPVDAPTLDGARLVGPTTARAAGEIVVDDVTSPSHVIDSGTVAFERASLLLAGERAKRLINGRGSL